MNRPSHKPLSLLALVPCLAAACGPAPVTPAATPAITAPIVVAPAASTATARVEAMPPCIDPATPRPRVVRVTDWLAQDHIDWISDSAAVQSVSESPTGDPRSCQRWYARLFRSTLSMNSRTASILVTISACETGSNR